MSFFNKIFGSDEPQNSSISFWNKIESEEDLEKAVEKSFEKKIVIFKHSTRCHISKMVLKNFENEVANSDKDVVYYFLDLIAHRPISNKIAEDFGVTHQSPQLIVLENGKAVKDASHQSISVNLI
ncbi:MULTISPECIES: bacillithiol system redox-active protein YtxJ [unclassified Kaistella]|uniref:bacillithiol system redox-active protein YtxJ n=1 Tax=unclassified Kaistella TaxID=2762626 RepID=UPI002734D636|nr:MULTISPECIES: bacillithiol system redox-active protein YtxJ [unclassified Kaistella]MDP2453984.1 bacillithiol system redox-active protein YtxJ [Kaistella sp. SH11-4b]MDP2457041.1 bacillithiol system redox-active protein YtxJ [Kaistella sp. SH40-3]MDP2459798.1 bacillithiol system redox-active protein YtxJ [Kaistella sp. SH19-2b]